MNSVSLKDWHCQGSYVYTLTWRIPGKKLSHKDMYSLHSPSPHLGREKGAKMLLNIKYHAGQYSAATFVVALTIALGNKDTQIKNREKVKWMKNVFKKNFES